MKPENCSEIEIEVLPSLVIARYQTISTAPEDDGWVYVQAWLAEKGMPAETRHFGFDIDVSAEDSQAGKRGYEYWMVVPEGTQPDEKVKIDTFPGGLYGAMTLYQPFSDPFNRIPGGWKILHEWVIGSEQVQGGPHQWLEEALNTDDGVDLKLYHPIMTKKEAALESR
jgi:hypothetical protein